jgi:hypothetical protein
MNPIAKVGTLGLLFGMRAIPQSVELEGPQRRISNLKTAPKIKTGVYDHLKVTSFPRPFTLCLCEKYLYPTGREATFFITD